MNFNSSRLLFLLDMVEGTDAASPTPPILKLEDGGWLDPPGFPSPTLYLDTMKMATHASRNTIFNLFTCVILLLSIMINHCEGSLLSSKKYANECNGTMAECPTLVDEDDEFLMDNEDHRRILAATRTISYDSLKTNPACGGNCGGLYNVQNKQCLTTYRCKR
ncbi:hypothetical protein QVD17_18661 [Tagetes erecta]|uniref:Rapid ALkalinization Factor n=1 Tax=Tagetes erecta TaxID=13708 RepID=A0AAD8NWA3_TARER|nr:hypothetical protein QVD17_18661 [Tagetes erecta]